MPDRGLGSVPSGFWHWVFLRPKRPIAREVAADTLFHDLAPGAASNAMYNALSAALAVLAGLGDGQLSMLSILDLLKEFPGMREDKPTADPCSIEVACVTLDEMVRRWPATVP
jgi:hypothetical protein